MNLLIDGVVSLVQAGTGLYVGLSGLGTAHVMMSGTAQARAPIRYEDLVFIWEKFMIGDCIRVRPLGM